MALTREQIEKMLGPVDTQLAAEIVATDATAEDLAQALVWLHSDEAMLNEGQHMPSGVVAELIGLLEAADDEDGMAAPVADGLTDWVD